MQKTLYQILIKVYSTETSNAVHETSSKYMKLGKLFIMKQNIIIYKIYKQDLFVLNRVSFSTNALPIARETIASLLEKPLDKLLNTDCLFSRGRSIISAILFQIPPRSEILHALSTSMLVVLYFILAYDSK